MTGTYFCKWYFLGILRDVVIARLLKDAEKAFENEQMLDLSEDELYNIMAKRPQVQGRKDMDVAYGDEKEVEKPEETKKEEEKKEGAKMDVDSKSEEERFTWCRYWTIA